MIDDVINELERLGETNKAQALKAQGSTPLIDAVDGNEAIKRVTFYYYDKTKEFVEVNLRSFLGYSESLLAMNFPMPAKPKGPYDGQPPAIPMQKLSDSLWEFSVDLPAEELTVAYKFEPRKTKEDKFIWGNQVADPFNQYGSRLDLLPREKPQQADSARLERYAIDDVGSIRELRSSQQPYEGERAFTIHFPKNYSRDTAYPMRLFLDGTEYLSGDSAPALLDSSGAINIMLEPKMLIENRRLEGSEQGYANRDAEYRPDRNIEAFSNWLADKAIPSMQQKFNIKEEPADVTIVGSSLSGFAACYIGLHHPEVFGNVLTQSAALWLAHEELSTLLRNGSEKLDFNQLKQSCFHLEAGSLENHDSVAMEGTIPIGAANSNFKRIMDERNILCELYTRNAAHDMYAWQKYLPEACQQLGSMRDRLAPTSQDEEEEITPKRLRSTPTLKPPGANPKSPF